MTVIGQKQTVEGALEPPPRNDVVTREGVSFKLST